MGLVANEILEQFRYTDVVKSLTRNREYHPSAQKFPSYDSSKNLVVFKDTPWLGGRHDGYPLVDFQQYLSLRNESHDAKELDTTAMWQCALTFGILEAVMEEKIPEESLLRVKSGKTYLVDDAIYDLLNSFCTRSDAVEDEHERKAWIIRACDAMNEANQLFNKAILPSVPWRGGLGVEYFCDTNLSGEDISSIILACSAISECLSFNCIHLYYLGAGSDLFRGPILGLWAEYLWIRYTREMTMRGWCPFVISMLRSYGPCAFVYASTKDPVTRRKDSGHGKCSTDTCVLNNIDTTSYENHHTTESCSCQYRGPILSDIHSLLDKGRIPVIVCDPQTLDVTVCSSTEVEFVAISHVWVDGLGSTPEKGLPGCQLQDIAQTVRQLLPAGGFWMDSLCVPDRHAGDLKRRAIGLMAETYKTATYTLVVDSGIRMCSKSSSLLEKLFRIVTSGWNQRLRTLQEALLAKNLVFQLQDGFENIQDLTLKANSGVSDPTLLRLGRVLHSFLEYKIALSRATNYPLYCVAQSITWRSTSREEDETLAIAGLFDIDAAKLAQLPPEDRMRSFLIEIGNLPENIIFFQGSARQDHPNFHWAPKTFMRITNFGLSARPRRSICTMEGLLGQYHGVKFNPIHVRADGQVRKWTFIYRDAGKVNFSSVLLENPRGAEDYYINMLFPSAETLPLSGRCVLVEAYYAEEIDDKEDYPSQFHNTKKNSNDGRIVCRVRANSGLIHASLDIDVSDEGVRRAEVRMKDHNFRAILEDAIYNVRIV